MDNRTVTLIGSFFWDRINAGQKNFWKNEAKKRNTIFNLHGKSKTTGFWIFSKYLVDKLASDGIIK